MMNDFSEVISLLQNATEITKILHWRTRSFAHHLTLDELHGALMKHTDRFAEVGIGLDPHALDSLTAKTVWDLSDANALTFIEQLTSQLESMGESLGEMHDVFESIFDDLMEDVLTVKYKLENLT